MFAPFSLLRIMVLNMMNLYTLIFALFGKVNTMVMTTPFYFFKLATN